MSQKRCQGSGREMRRVLWGQIPSMVVVRSAINVRKTSEQDGDLGHHTRAKAG